MALLRNILLLALAAVLVACSSGKTYAPVMDIATIQSIPASGRYRVARGDTLYQIAFRYGIDYTNLAHRNHLAPPYTLRTGQVIYLRGYAPRQAMQRMAYQSPPARQSAHAVVTKKVVKARTQPPVVSRRWLWPVQGRIVKGYAGLNKGINIGANFATPIRAANAGTVVYSGNGLRAYGNLIIIKHNKIYMSAYAHNSRLMVKEGDLVKKGQIIAEMGSSGANQVMLHFEIRRNGKPVNPMKILKS